MIYCGLAEMPCQELCFRMISSRRPGTGKCPRRIMRRVFQAVTLLLVSCPSAAWADDPNALTEKERKAGFKLLFNGRNLEGWQQKGNWTVKDGAMSRASGGGNLVYQASKIPDDFELRFQWRVAAGSNSGVYYRPGQYEYQILDNQLHVDGKNPRTSAASVYFCMAPSRDATNPVGEWNSGRIACQGTVIQHWLNGQKVVGFDYTDSRWASNVELLRKRGGNLPDRGAFLNLQDHGDPVWYRGFKLRELAARDMLDRTPVRPAQISDEVLKLEAQKLERILKSRKQKR